MAQISLEWSAFYAVKNMGRSILLVILHYHQSRSYCKKFEQERIIMT